MISFILRRGNVAIIKFLKFLYNNYYCRGDSLWNKKVKAKLCEEIMLADKENGFRASDVNSMFFSVNINNYCVVDLHVCIVPI